MAKKTSKVIKISSKVGETTSKLVYPISHIIIFTLNFALNTSKFKPKITFLHFFKQTKEQSIFRVQFTEYRVQLPSGWRRGHFMSARKPQGVKQIPDGKTPKVSPLSNRGVRAKSEYPRMSCSAEMHPEGCAPIIGPDAGAPIQGAL